VTLVRLLANLGYGSRREVETLLRRRQVHGPDGGPLRASAADPGGPLWVAGEPLDPRAPLVLLLHKPAGFVCTASEDEGPTVLSLLPPRFARRRPVLATVGRLDKDSSGLLLLTDDGALLHHLTSPRHAVEKVYRATLARDLAGAEAQALATGELLLRGEERPLRPARVEVLGPREVRVAVTEGRYHLVRRMWAALGNHVQTLHRERMGSLDLAGLNEGSWRVLEPAEQAQLRGAAAD